MSQAKEINGEALIAQVQAASATWVDHFNAGRVDECVAVYLPDAVMDATPFGTFTGHAEIDGF